jgi:hypothetical protein
VRLGLLYAAGFVTLIDSHGRSHNRCGRQLVALLSDASPSPITCGP